MSTKSNYDTIMETKAAEAELVELQPEIDNSQVLKDDLASGTQVAEFRLWAWIVAFAMNSLQSLWGAFKKDIEAIENDKEPPTDGWWKATILNFQTGYLLVWQSAFRKYLYDDTESDAAKSARIVKFCSIGEFEGDVLIKVAADNGAGLPAQITNPQLIEIQEYARQLRPPGTQVYVLSRPADKIKVIGTIFFNPLADESLVKQLVEAAITDFDNYLTFNGTYNITKLVDNLQKIEGVTEPYDFKVFYKYGSLSYTPVVRQYQTFAGYVAVSTTVGERLEDTITYTRDV